jgi:uncharacterized membrane protein YgcG
MTTLKQPSGSHLDAVRVFNKLTNNGEYLNQEQFCHALIDELDLNLSKEEANRLFLQQCDTNGEGVVRVGVFVRAVRDNVFLTRIVSSLSHKHTFEVSTQYNYTQSTATAYTHANYIIENKWGTSTTKEYDCAKHGEVYGDFIDIRKALDYSWHPNYTVERQLWQDRIIKDVAQRHAPVRWPWLVLTCGAMGAGKGYCLRWLSRTGVFPLDNVVKIDPDHFKSVMPEWNEYKTYDATHQTITAGNNTHKESGFVQELCQTVSLQLRQNTWIDGSLQDVQWWTDWISHIRTVYPWYRIAIFYVYAKKSQVLARAHQRGQVTGRFIEQAKLLDSIEKTKIAIEMLGPLADFVARIDNSGTLPKLDVFEDRSHSLRAISDRFRGKSDRAQRFPESLGTMSLQPLHSTLLRTSTPIKEQAWKELTGPASLALIDVSAMFALDGLDGLVEESGSGGRGGSGGERGGRGGSGGSGESGRTGQSCGKREAWESEESRERGKSGAENEGKVDDNESNNGKRGSNNGTTSTNSLAPPPSTGIHVFNTAQLSLSQTHATTLDDHSRSIAGIPSNADVFCWAHPLQDQESRTILENNFNAKQYGATAYHGLLQLLLYGGYIYFQSSTQSVVAVNAVCPHKNRRNRRNPVEERQTHYTEGWTFRLEFEQAQILPKDYEQKQMKDRWVKCVDPILMQEGVTDTAWLLPGELATCPMGGFAFQIKKQNSGGSIKMLYFAVDTS